MPSADTSSQRPDGAAAPARDADRRDHVRRNYLAHVADGGLFVGGITVLSAQTVLPPIVKKLGGPDWLVGLMPIAMIVGFMLPSVLTAHLIERLRRYKPLCLMTGIGQRLPFLVTGVLLMVRGEDAGVAALVAVALSPLLSGTSAGISQVAWQQLVLKTIPVRRRNSVMAWRDMVGCVLGVAAGWVVKTVLGADPTDLSAQEADVAGYGLLHLLAFGLMVASYFSFMAIKEEGPHHDVPQRPPGLLENLRLMPGILGTDHRLVLYILSRTLAAGMFVLVPWLAIYAQRTTGLPDGFFGELVIAQMLGAILGSLTAGAIGDRSSSKTPLVLGRTLLIVLAAGMWLAGSRWAFLGLFALFGFALNMQKTGDLTLLMELCPRRRRPTYLAISAVTNLPGLVVASLVSGVLWRDGAPAASFARIAVVAGVCLAGSLALLWRLSDPRTDPPAGATE